MCARPPLPGPLLSTPKPSTNRRCALSVASLLDKTRLACTLDKHPSFEKHFQSSPPNQWRPNGRPIPLLGPLHRFHPSIRARNTCRKTRAEVYKALGFPRGRLSQASVQYFRSCKLLSLGTWSSCSLSSGSYELVTECLNSLPRNLGKRGRSEEGPPAPPAAEPGLYT